MQETGIAPNQYLTCSLERSVFALDISSVREILDYTGETPVPRTPEYVRGVINLRGTALPVIDMRRRFGLSPLKDLRGCCIIVVEAHTGQETLLMGALADAVREVVEIPPDAVEPPPRFGTAVDTTYIRGMSNSEGDFIIILDVDRVFSSDLLSDAKDALSSNA